MNILSLSAAGALGALAFTVSRAHAASKVYVTASGAKLKAEKSASSKTVGDLPVGTALNVRATDGSWYQVVSASGAKGWIYRGKVSETPPPAAKQAQGGDVNNLLGSLGGSSISAGSTDTSRSIRGLSPEAQEYADQTGTPMQYQQALDEVLNRKIQNQDVDRFLEQGKIGEYADAS